MKFLLKKKFKFIIFGLLVIIATGFVVFVSDKDIYNGNTSILATDVNIDARTKALDNIKEKDSDNDGLKDWEEALWNTDPNNPDTDGDGIKDGDEITKNGKQNSVEFDKEEVIKRDTPLTLTDEFAINVLNGYLLGRNSNKPLSAEEKSNLINSVEQSLYNTVSDSDEKMYRMSDLVILEDVSSSSTKNYGNLLGLVVIAHSAKAPDEDELTIFNNALEGGDPKEIKKLDTIIEGYNNILRDSLLVPVPRDAVKEHLAIVQNMSLLISALKDMKVVFDDPIRAVIGLGKHKNGTEELTKTLKNIRLYFMRKGIVFGEYDMGSAITNI